MNLNATVRKAPGGAAARSGSPEGPRWGGCALRKSWDLGDFFVTIRWVNGSTIVSRCLSTSNIFFRLNGVSAFFLAFLFTTIISSLPAAEAITPDQVVDKGIKALMRLQAPDGSFGGSLTSVTSLCGMALLAGGHTPTRSSYQQASAKALKYVLSAQDKVTGYLGDGLGRMYAHGFATLYLAECYGMAPEAHLRMALNAAVELIYRSQNQQGGWRYDPVPNEADISVTICQIMALRAAFNVGVGASTDKAIPRAVSYVRHCHNGDGSFGYQGPGTGWVGGGGGAEGVARCAAGCMSLISSGINDTSDPVLGPGLRFLLKNFETHLKGQGDYYWYGQYYTAQALFHSPDPKDWERYWSVAWPIIASGQNADGLWSRNDSVGPAYNTAMALIILQIPNNYLPIFQR